MDMLPIKLQKPPGRRRAIVVGVILLLTCIQAELHSAAGGSELIVTAGFSLSSTGQAVGSRQPLELRLNRPLLGSEGRIAVTVGREDVTSLLVTAATTITYEPKIIPLPIGETRVVVYLVSPSNQWKEIATFAIRVEASSPAGAGAQQSTSPQQTGLSSSPAAPAPAAHRRWIFDKAGITPSFTIGLKTQVVETHFPDSNRPQRSTFADVTLQGSVRSEMSRDTYHSQIQFDLVGSSFQQEALRFGQEGDRAPRIDLSSYLMQFQVGKAMFKVGHIAFGANRFLINSFSSRGVSMTLPVTTRADVSVAALNGTNVVGWSNFFGLSRSNHRVVAGTIGFEFLKERPGGLRLETSITDGEVLPINSFNQSAIVDAERSRGVGLRLVASDRAMRWRLDGGYARSRFTNPPDPLLFQSLNIVPVREVTRDARYLEASYVLLKDLALGETRKANVTVNYRHENIAPLFRSVSAFLQPDREQNQVDVIAVVGDVTATVGHQRFRDNLDNIPSILKTLSRRNNFILGAPLSSLIGNPAKPSPWLPRVSYGFDQIHQFAPTIPVGGGFELNPSTIPDQMTRNQNLTADWQWKKARFGYRFNRSLQDNRQIGREQADLRNLVHGFSFGLSPTPTLDLSIEANAENAFNKEATRTDRTFRLGPAINWRLNRQMTLGLSLSGTTAGNTIGTSRNRNADVDAQWSYRFSVERSRYRKVQGNFFIRYTRRYASAFDSIFGFSNLTRLQTVNAGLSFTFF